MILNIFQVGNKYYIATDQYDYYASFRDIHARLYLHMHSEDFQNIMFNKFNAFCNEKIGTGPRYYFLRKKYAEAALDWIESKLVMAKLSGETFF